MIEDVPVFTMDIKANARWEVSHSTENLVKVVRGKIHVMRLYTIGIGTEVHEDTATELPLHVHVDLK
jgi:hypothetical protein